MTRHPAKDPFAWAMLLSFGLAMSTAMWPEYQQRYVLIAAMAIVVVAMVSVTVTLHRRGQL